MPTPVYCTLDYRQYKRFEEQFADGVGPLESEHKTQDLRFYHKAIRFEIGDLVFEVTGPAVMAPPLPGFDIDTEREAMEADIGGRPPPGEEEGSDQ